MRIVLFEALIETHVRDSLARALMARGHEVLAPPAVWQGSTYPNNAADKARCAAAMMGALAWQPDVLLNFRPSSMTTDDLALVRARGITSVIWLSDDPVLYQSTYRETVDAYDLVLNCGDAHILDFYTRKHGIIGVNFPFWTDTVACPRAAGPKLFDAAFLGNCFGDVRANRYDLIAGLPGTVRIFGQVDSDPQGLSAGYEKDHAALMQKLGGARFGFNVPQVFSDYRHNSLNFPELARLGSFQTPSRVAQYAALGLPILTCGLHSAPDWFPEMLTGKDGPACATVARKLLDDPDQQAALSDAVHNRFVQSYSAARRADFLDWLLTNPAKWKDLTAQQRARLYDRFDDPKARFDPPPPRAETIEDVRQTAARLQLRAEHPLKILAIGAALNGPTDIVACHIRALRALGHSVLQIDPFQRRDILDNTKIVGGGFGGNMLNPDRVLAHATPFGADIVLTLGGGLGFTPDAASLLRQQGLVLVGVTLSDPDVQDSILETARNFDVHFTNSKLALGRYLDVGLGQTHLMPFAIDRSWVAYDSRADENWTADVICLGHATGRADRNAAMAALSERFGNVRTYGRGWEVSAAGVNRGPVAGGDLLNASRGGLLHVNFPRTAKGFTNVKCGVFETIGSGGVLLTEPFEELAELFDYTSEIVGYADTADLCEKVDWLLRNPAERTALQLNAMRRLVTCHLYEHRWLAAWECIKPAHPAGPSGWHLASATPRCRVVIAGLNPALPNEAAIIAALGAQIRRDHPMAELVLLSPEKAVDGLELIRLDQTAAWAQAAAEADVVVLRGDRVDPDLAQKGRVSLPRAFALLADQGGAMVHMLPQSPLSPDDLPTVHVQARAMTGLAGVALYRSPAVSAGQDGAVADQPEGLWHATGELRAVPNPKELPAPGVTLTPTPISLRISGPPNSKLSLTLRVNAHPDEAGNAAVVQIEVGSEKGEAESIYGHFNQQLGRFRYLPRPNRAGLCRLEFLLPPDGVIRLAFRGWRNQHAIQISETVAIEV